MTTGSSSRGQRLRGLPLSYSEVGATAGAGLPPGYRWIDRTVVLGAGADVFERAGRGLLSWQMHRDAGLRIEADSPTVVAGADVSVIVGRRPLALIAPCRVVYTVTEPDRRGFAYGTLPGHPESGEESFIVSRDEAGRVTFAVRAFSRPATVLARCGGPITRFAQDRATTRYLNSLKRIATG